MNKLRVKKTNYILLFVLHDNLDRHMYIISTKRTYGNCNVLLIL